MPETRFILLTSAGAEADGIGSLFLRELLARLEGVSAHWYQVKPFLLGSSLVHLGWAGRALRSVLVRFRRWQDARLRLFRVLVLRRRARTIESAMVRLGVNKIWLTASTPELISLGSELADRGHDVRVTVWDSPDYLVRNLRLGPRSINQVMLDFANLMEKAQAATVVSEEMRAGYEARYAVPCEIVRHGAAARDHASVSAEDDILKIVFAGSLYCKTEWNCFVGALQGVQWQIAGKHVRLVFLGQFPLAGAVRPDEVEVRPPIPHDAALDVMAGMEIGYLPYWFDREHETVARTSFPGKMTAYAAAGLGVFHHGPRYSSVTRFLERFPFGIACDSLEAGVILDRLEELARRMGTAGFAEARNRALEEELSETATRAAFRRFVVRGRRARAGEVLRSPEAADSA